VTMRVLSRSLTTVFNIEIQDILGYFVTLFTHMLVVLTMNSHMSEERSNLLISYGP
jgi:hypothetical protein